MGTVERGSADGAMGRAEALGALLRTDAATGIPEGRRVEMQVHRQLDGAARDLLRRQLGARFADEPGTEPGTAALLGGDVRVEAERRSPYYWLVRAYWPDGVVPTTSAAQVRAAFRTVLADLSR